MARLALSFGGALIGGAIGGSTGARIGWALGSVAGSILFAESVHTEGPRLGDLKVTSSAYGNPIPKIYGSYRVAGNIIWSAGIKETSHTQDVGGGKGGGGSQTHTSYTYSCSFALGLGEGEIAGIRKIWADGVVIYSKGSAATANELLASNKAGVTIYPGSENQLPSSTIEASEGIGSTPAFRGLAYILFDDFQLANYGNRIPNITCEVVEVGSTSIKKITEFISPLPSERSWASVSMYSDSSKIYYMAAEIDYWLNNPTNCQAGIVGIDGSYVEGEYHINSLGGSIPQGHSDTPAFATQDTIWPGGATPVVFHHLNPTDATITQSVEITIPGPETSYHNGGSVHKRGNYIYLFRYIGQLLKAEAYSDSTAVVLGLGTDFGIPGLLHDIAVSPSYIYGIYNSKYFVKWDHDFNLISSVLINFPATWFVHYGGTETELYCENDSVVWLYSGVYLSKVVDSVLIATYTVEYIGYQMAGGWNVQNNILTVISNDYDSVRQWDLNLLSPQTRQLGEIITDLCNEAGVASANIDVTTISTEVKGYARTSPMSARAALSTLLNAYSLTAVESDYKLKFEIKNGTYDVTVAETDLAATVSEGELPDRLSIVRVQDTDIPRRITVAYSEESRNYEPGIQYAQRIKT